MFSVQTLLLLLFIFLIQLPPSDRLSQLGNVSDFKMDPTIVSVASAILLTTTNAALGKVNVCIYTTIIKHAVIL